MGYQLVILLLQMAGLGSVVLGQQFESKSGIEELARPANMSGDRPAYMSRDRPAYMSRDRPANMSGDRPAYMSRARLRQLNLIQLKEGLDRIKSKEVPVHSRQKRSLEEGGLLVTIPIGFYKQESLKIKKLGSLADKTAVGLGGRTNVVMVKIVDYVDDNTITKLKFIVQKNSASDVRVFVEGLNAEGTQWIPFTAIDDDFSEYVDFTSIPGAKISDIAMGNNPKSVFNFLCLTIDYKLQYPRTDEPELNINDPLPIPEAAKSLLFNFVLTPQGFRLQKIYQAGPGLKSVLDTSEAKDCEFWVTDGHLMLGIAQTGNNQTDQPLQRSKIYVQTDEDTQAFEEMVGQGEEYVTYEAVKVLPFDIKGRSCVLFVNSWKGRNESPIYCYNFQTRKFALSQDLNTFGAQDAALLSIDDSYPIHSQFFIIVCNTEELYSGQASRVSPTIFKNIRGRFIPIQTLSEFDSCEAVNAYSTQTAPVTPDSDLPRFKTVDLKHFVSFMQTDGVLKIYQYDGTKFVFASELTVPSTERVGDIINLSTNPEEPEICYLLKADGDFNLYTPNYIDDSMHKMSSTSTSMLKYCLGKTQDRLTQNSEILYHDYIKAPVKDDLTTGVKIQSATFDGSIEITSAFVEKGSDDSMKVEVANLQAINGSYPAQVSQLDSQVEDADNAMDQLKVTVNTENCAHVNKNNNFAGPVNLVGITGTELTGVRLSLDDTFKVLESVDGTVQVDMDEFYVNICIISGPRVNEAGFFLRPEVEFENIVINEGYDINLLHNSSILDYVDINNDTVVVTGKVSLAADCRFKSTVNAETINANVVDDATLLLRTGDQNLQNIKLTDTAIFNVIHINDLNGANLEILDKALTVEDALVLNEDLTVDKLTVNGQTETLVTVSKDLSQTVIQFDDLLNNHLKLSGNSNVKVTHEYTSASGLDIDVEGVNDSSWPNNYINIASGNITHSNSITMQSAVLPSGILVENALIMTGNRDQIDVDASNTLPLIPVVDNSNTATTINAAKTFNAIKLNAAATVNGQLQGLDPTVLKGEVTTGKRNYLQSVTTSHATITGEVDIVEVELGSSTIKTGCKDGCNPNDLSNLFNGIKRTATEINNAKLNLNSLHFSDNVNVETIDDIDPENDFVMLDETAEVTLNNISFMGPVSFAKNLVQAPDAQLIACNDNAVRRIYCKPELCLQGSNQCEVVDKECLVKHGINDETLCEDPLLTQNIHYVWENSLKTDEEVSLSRSVFFHGGFKTNTLEIRSDECSFNSADCLNIASTQHDETFTAKNVFNGDPTLKGEASIENLSVDGIVDNVDVSDMYMDTLFIDSTTPQQVDSILFKTKFSTSSFQANGISIGSTSPSNLATRDDNIALIGSDSSLTSKVVFQSTAQIKKIDAVTVNSVVMNNYYTNKITAEANQEVSGDITVQGDLIFQNAALKGAASAIVNNLDIVNLEAKAVKINGDSIIFKNVNFNGITVHADRGLTVQDEFVGISVPNDIVTRDASTVQVAAGKTFTSPDCQVSGLITLTDVEWKKTDSGSNIQINKLFSFMDESSLDSVKFTTTLTVENEPTIVNLNEESLVQRILSVWRKDMDSEINFKLTFETLKATNVVEITAGNEHINDINIVDLNNYVSKFHNLAVTANLNFLKGLVVESLVDTPLVSLQSGEEKGVTTANINIKMKELVAKAVHRNGTNGNLAAQLVINMIAANEIKLSENLATNGVDLSDLALTYTDTKKFDNNVDVTSNANISIAELISTSPLNFVTLIDSVESHDGVTLSENNIAVNWENLKANAVYKDDLHVAIGDSKTFSGAVDMADLEVVGLTSNLDIGSCDGPNILLSAPCSGEEPQAVSGTFTFANNVDANSVVLETNLNGENFDSLKSEFIFKTDSASITFSGDNTFATGLEVDSTAEFGGLVLGGNVADLKAKELAAVDMTYDSGVEAPNVTSLLQHVNKESRFIQDKFLFATKIETLTENKGVLISLTLQNDQFPGHMIGLEVTSESTGELKLFACPEDYAQKKVNKLSSFSTSEVVIRADLGTMDMLPIYGSDTTRLIMINGFLIKNMISPLNKLPLTSEAGSTSGYLAVLSLDVSGGDMIISVTQDIFNGESTEDFASLVIGEKRCVVVCRGTLGASIICLNLGTMLFEHHQDLDATACYSVSATPDIESMNTDTQSFISVYTKNTGKEISVYKLGDDNQFKLVQESCGCANLRTKLFAFKDNGQDITLMVLLPSVHSNLEILNFNPDSDKFELMDEIRDINVKDVSFIQRAGHVLMHVLALEEDFTYINTYMFRGYGKYSSFAPIETVKKNVDIRYIDVSLTYMGEHKLVITSGPDKYQNSITLGYVNQENDVEKLREEFAESASVPPSFISMDCHTMLAANLKKLYQDTDYELDAVSNLFLRIMPNQHIRYRNKDFTDSVRAVLENSEFQDLLEPETPTAVANMYKYVESGRDLTDSGYMGSILLYKSQAKEIDSPDTVAYIYGRLLLAPDTADPTYHGISFWTSCRDDATQVEVAPQYDGEAAKPKFADDPDGLTRHQCSFLHGIPAIFNQKLNNLDNKGDAGAIVIHKTSSTTSEKYGCGYLKVPVTAKIQFFRDHTEENIGIAPFIQYTV